MSIRVNLFHRTAYKYERSIALGPQTIRLKPAPHCRTPILSYSQKVLPTVHFCNWQQDPQGNFVSRYVFPEKTEQFEVVVSLVADMAVINPFDFFIDEEAEQFPFTYDPNLAADLAPFLRTEPMGPLMKKWMKSVDRSKRRTVLMLVDLNTQLQQAISYAIRMEPGVQTPEQTLKLRKGSCRDSAWLLVHIFRNLGLAARFVSGYLIQLTSDVKSLDGPSGPTADFTDLHAWTEVYIPGAGWIGLDPTSGLLCGEGHLPLACTPEPASAAPISGALEPCKSDFEFEMTITRLHEEPRTTKPYTQQQWKQVIELGRNVDQTMNSLNMRMTVGGEPTFVSIDDMEGEEWNGAAVGPTKRKLSGELVKRLRRRFAPGGMLHYGQGKWYPGESLPRWALACYWRTDGQALWHDEDLIADEGRDYGFGYKHARRFAKTLATSLGVEPGWLMPAYEDALYYIWKERKLPVNVDPSDPKLDDPEERQRMSRVFTGGMSEPVGIVLPLKREYVDGQQQKAQQQQADPNYRWSSGPWPLRLEQLFLLPGDSPIGLRLPVESLPHRDKKELVQDFIPTDPFANRNALPPATNLQQQYRGSAFYDSTAVIPDEVTTPSETVARGGMPEHSESQTSVDVLDSEDTRNPFLDDESGGEGSSGELPKPEDAERHPPVRTAMCIEPREGKMYVFMPPVERLEDYVDLLAAVEATAAELKMPVIVEGYLPPLDHRIGYFKVTPDPGVIEVNVQPASSWDELVTIIEGLYEDARLTRLGTEKFDLDGKHTGTGGGNHIVFGGSTPADSPFLRRPDLLRSVVAYWINHPSLSYIFGSRFCGPTSQSPRVDEGRRDAIYELQMALEVLPASGEQVPPWLVDRVLRNLLIDLTGNTHRAEICIDKLFSPDSAAGRLGLVEFRAFEMPPHAQTNLTMHLLLRSLITMFWQTPYDQRVIEWGTQLHDRFMLPHFLKEDLTAIVNQLQRGGFNIDAAWFEPHYEFRMPTIGNVVYDGVQIELRAAIEPWYVLGEEPAGGATVRYVDSSVERLQVKATGMDPLRHQMLVNGFIAPMQVTAVPGQYVAGVRYRAWQPPSCLHPTIPVHTPLVFDLLDTHSGKSLGGCTYHVSHPAGRNYESFPINGLEAESRRASRFTTFGTPDNHLVGKLPRSNPDYPMTLDLRREKAR